MLLFRVQIKRKSFVKGGMCKLGKIFDTCTLGSFHIEGNGYGVYMLYVWSFTSCSHIILTIPGNVVIIVVNL